LVKCGTFIKNFKKDIMDLILPEFGLLFWTGLVFICLLFVLTKFIWKPILSSVNEREQKITEALELADKTKAEMKTMQAENQNLLKEARAERDAIVKDAKEIATRMVEDAKVSAKLEAEKIAEAARLTVAAERNEAIADLKNQVAIFSIEIAEKIVRADLTSDEKQKALAEKMAGDINLN
jgi:F-type H+-transporting ATPase subunit b